MRFYYSNDKIDQIAAAYGLSRLCSANAEFVQQPDDARMSILLAHLELLGPMTSGDL
jgi:hypothetical protein